MIHCFDSDIAEEYGLTEAIILQNIAFWIAKNEANERNYYEGDYWTYNSIKAFKNLFPYLTEKKIRNALERLIQADIIRVGNYNTDRRDRSLWYSLTEKGKCIYQKGQMQMSERANAFIQKGKCINTDNKQQIINTDNKHNYGEFGNVLLTPEEYEKVKVKGLLDILEELSCYIEQIGQKAADKKYKSHYATICNWGSRKKANTKAEKMKSGKLSSPPSFDLEKIKKDSEFNDNYLEQLGLV